MKTLRIVSFVILSTAALATAAQGQDYAAPTGLDDLKWRCRAIVISAPAARDTAHRDVQAQWLADHGEALSERRVVQITMTGDDIEAVEPAGGSCDAYGDLFSSGSVSAERIRAAFALAADRFAVALIGLDGTVKKRWSEPVGVEELFDLIDAMPMRRDEIRREEERLDFEGR